MPYYCVGKSLVGNYWCAIHHRWFVLVDFDNPFHEDCPLLCQDSKPSTNKDYMVDPNSLIRLYKFQNMRLLHYQHT